MVEKRLFEKNYKKIKKILDIADTSEYYHDLFTEANIDLSSEVSYDDFQRIPKTDKSIYEKNKYKMITKKISGFSVDEINRNTDLADRLQYYTEHGIKQKVTSGSTEQPLEVIKGQKDVFRDYVSLNANRKKMTSYNFEGRFVQVWPVNRAIYQKYTNGKELREATKLNDRGYMYFLCEHSQENLMNLYRFIVNNKCEWITSSPTVLYKLSKLVLDNDLDASMIKYAECHSEKLYEWQREMIYKAFKCDITSIYSSNEVQFIAGECKNGKMHLFEKSCFLEIVPDEKGYDELLLTSLNYCEVPIIRYKIGDCGKWIENSECDCEFGDLQEFEIYGFRKNDFIKTKDGEVEPFLIADSIFTLAHEAKIYISTYRAVQTDYNKFSFYVPKLNLKNKETIRTVIQNFIGAGLGRDDIEVFVGEFNLDDTTYDSRKFKYFESMI